MNPLWWLLIPASYLLGSLSFAWMAGRLRGIDLRQHGSGNLGATNAGRVLGRPWFFIVFGGDLLKGLLPVLIALHGPSAPSPWLDLSCGAAAILGHSFTCFHGFRGGKAVSTTLGVFLGMLWLMAAICFAFWCLAWLLGWLAFRHKASDAVGPASILAALAMLPVHCLTYAQPWAIPHLPLTCFVIIIAGLILFRHRSNLKKMLAKRAPAA